MISGQCKELRGSITLMKIKKWIAKLESENGYFFLGKLMTFSTWHKGTFLQYRLDSNRRLKKYQSECQSLENLLTTVIEL